MRDRASGEYEAILAMIPDDFSDPGDSLEQIRAKFDLVHSQDPGAGILVDDHSHGLWVHDDAAGPDDRVVLWAHSGGFVTSPGDACAFWAGFVVRECGLPVLLVDWPLAPEAVFPAQVDALTDAHDALLESGTDPGRVIFMGDSCGGGMAVAAMVRQHERGRPGPGAFVGLGGWYDLEVRDVRGPGEDPFVNADWLRLRGRDYVGPDGDPADPLVSVVHADLRGLPPMLLQTGEVDPCLPGALVLAANAAAAGVEAVVDTVPGVAQGFQGMAGVPEAVAAWRRVAAFVDERVPR